MSTVLRKSVLLFFNIIFTFCAFAQQHQHNRKITFPDLAEYKTLKCDFHQHAIFSDGEVYPSIRVKEALKDGLDAIAITEHLEYQPHKKDIPHPDRNRAYQIALETKASLEDTSLLITNGAEITRNMPPGHCNAIFIKDANLLLDKDPLKVFKAANNQGAFVFWNHPNWVGQTTDGISRLHDLHKLLIKEKLLHGIEIVNEHTYSDEALDIALANQLTFMGSSDIHGLIDWEFKVHEGGHRPVTLVFAKEKTLDAIKAALFEGHTAVWHNNTLIGKEKFLKALIEASLLVKKAKYLKLPWSQHKRPLSILNLYIENISDAAYILANTSEYKLHNGADIISIPAHETTLIQVKTLERKSTILLSFEVLNAVVTPEKHAHIQMLVPIKEEQ